MRLLLDRACAEDAEAWRELIGLFSSRVYALALSRLRDPESAEEIAQSVFVTVAEKLGSGRYREQGRFESWLFRIAANRVRDEQRRRMNVARRFESGEHATAEIAAPGRDTSTSREIDALRRVIDGLSEADRDVIELRHHANLAFKEIAQVLNQPVGTVLARHHRALSKLRDLMEAEESGGIGNE